ncbi:type II CRISPR-associated endonuclease Cas1 [Vagococcus sp. DIV0080]|uniref:CRISPR-associated endonuclease Cas1 n=1 Tax=Candidatus Vagococcus giribetii TaxID=2230876 RepID=A0ABS3HU61_9ENTE|nr:type II CRISPR-associated endonuclease Cas1 [Vagococcus sp. DIV0080]MBO0477240.1 type II CRISPR-associated endonuclease Cas1 [Vagococcus sp. DIV0080]
MGFRTVFVKNGETLRVKLDNLEVVKERDSFIIPLSDIESVILEGEQTSVSSRILAKFAQYHIELIVCDSKYLPAGVFLGLGQYHRSAKRAIWQSDWTEEQKQTIWTEIVRQKINNQIAFSEYVNIKEERLNIMKDLRDNLQLGDETNREGHVAKVYFNSHFGLGFTREDDSLPNACMDYGYAIVRAQMARCVVAQGMLPMLGVFHRNEYNSFNLVDDLMEPFRPLMDYYIHRHVLSTDEEYLTYDNRIQLIDFLNQKIKINNKKIYINQCMTEYVISFIKSMEKREFSYLMEINLADFVECERK